MTKAELEERLELMADHLTVTINSMLSDGDIECTATELEYMAEHLRFLAHGWEQAEP